MRSVAFRYFSQQDRVAANFMSEDANVDAGFDAVLADFYQQPFQIVHLAARHARYVAGVSHPAQQDATGYVGECADFVGKVIAPWGQRDGRR